MNLLSNKKTLIGGNHVIDENLGLLKFFGEYNKIKIKSHVQRLSIEGFYNEIDGLDPNCLINRIFIKGEHNKVILNKNCINVTKSITGENTIEFGSANNDRNNTGSNANQNPGNSVQNNNNRLNNTAITNNSNNMNMNNSNNAMNQFRNLSNNQMMWNNFGYNVRNTNQNVNQTQNQYSIPSLNQNINQISNQNSNSRFINQIPNQNNNSRINNSNNQYANLNNSNVPQNRVYNSNVLFSTKNLSDFDKKKDNLFLEMDQYQYKHIQKYDSRRETECAICLEEFKRNDIIKEFYNCKHIFHKDCLKDWLKRSNTCPLCKHDLTEDINKMSKLF